MQRNEIWFYLVVGVGVFILEIANSYNVGLCLYLPIMLGICFVGLKVFPASSNK
jgi:hypothetical protein